MSEDAYLSDEGFDSVQFIQIKLDLLDGELLTGVPPPSSINLASGAFAQDSPDAVDFLNFLHI